MSYEISRKGLKDVKFRKFLFRKIFSLPPLRPFDVAQDILCGRYSALEGGGVSDGGCDGGAGGNFAGGSEGFANVGLELRRAVRGGVFGKNSCSRSMRNRVQLRSGEIVEVRQNFTG